MSSDSAPTSKGGEGALLVTKMTDIKKALEVEVEEKEGLPWSRSV
jgi:hypothetical protein